MTKLIRVSELTRMQRRRSFRLQFLFDVYSRKKEDDTPYIKCQGIDISEAGIGVNTSQNLKIG